MIQNAGQMLYEDLRNGMVRDHVKIELNKFAENLAPGDRVTLEQAGKRATITCKPDMPGFGLYAELHMVSSDQAQDAMLQDLGILYYVIGCPVCGELVHRARPERGLCRGIDAPHPPRGLTSKAIWARPARRDKEATEIEDLMGKMGVLR